MPEDYEKVLRDLAPRIKWMECSSSQCKLSDFDSRKGIVAVPGDYDHPDKTFDLTFQRFTRNTKPPMRHVIVLAGGPGESGRSVEDKVKTILNGLADHPIACYTVDHRGLGESGPFLAGKKYKDVRNSFESFFSNTPFPVKNLRTHDAALDVGMLAMAIQNEGDFPAQSTLHLIGGSYGATWANQVISLMPNLFNSVYLSAMPRLRNTIVGSGIGIAENCSLDDECRKRIGGKVSEEYRIAIKNVAKYTTNECTKALGDCIPKYKETDDAGRLTLLAVSFEDLMNNSFFLGEDNKASQLLLPFIKATSDCTDVAGYKRDVIGVMKKHMKLSVDQSSLDESQEKSLGKHSKLDKMVNSVGFIDLLFYNGPPNLHPPGNDDLFDDLAVPYSYLRLYNELKPHLANMKFTEHHPLTSTKTRVWLEMGRMDLITDYVQAWDTFEKINAPEKAWILINSQGHGFSDDTCLHTRLAEFLDIPAKGAGKKCVALVNSVYKLDWSFKNSPAYAKIWDYVKTSNKETLPIEKQLSAVPTYYHISGRVDGLITGLGLVLTIIILTACATVLAAAVLGGIYFYRRNKRSNSPSTTQVPA